MYIYTDIYIYIYIQYIYIYIHTYTLPLVSPGSHQLEFLIGSNAELLLIRFVSLLEGSDFVTHA